MGNQFKNPLSKKGPSATQSDEWPKGGAQPAAPGDRLQGSMPPAAQQSSGLGGGLFVPPWKPGAQAPAPAALVEEQTRKQPSVPPAQTSYASGAPVSLPRTPEAYVQGQHARYGPGAGVQQMSPSMHNGPQQMSPSMHNGPQQMSPSMHNGPQQMSPGMQSTPQQLSPSFANTAQGFNNGPQNMPPGPVGFAGGPATGMPPMPPGGPGRMGPLGGPGMAANGPQMFAPPQAPYPGKPMGGPGAGMAGGPPAFPQQSYNSFNQTNPASAFAASGITAPPAPLPGTFNRERAMGTGALGDGLRNPREIRRDGPPPGKDPRGNKRKKKRRVPIWARVVIGFLLVVIVLGGGGGFIYYQANYAAPVSSIVGQTVARAKNEGDPNSNLTNGILTGPRVNILLLGSDTDQKFVNGQYIAQTDIIVTIDPSSKTVGMLSIPRDFFLPVPGYGMHKLDEAYGLGGVALSRQTIEQDFGIPINYYAWVGLDGFIKVINEVNGVDVDVQHPIVDDNYPDDVGKNANDPYAVKRLYLAPGPQHLDGPTALEYVRSRHADLVGDFGRSARQQQVLSGLKTKLANADIFNKLPSIANDLQGFLKTDMALPDILKLMNFARSLDLNKLDKLTLGPPYSSGGVAPAGGNDAGADIVIPNCAQIVPAIQKMLQLGSNAACNVTGDSGGNPTSLPLAYRTGKISSQAYAPTSNTDNLSSLFSQFGDASSGSTGNPADLFGVQGLLDLMLMGIFESPNVF